MANKPSLERVVNVLVHGLFFRIRKGIKSVLGQRSAWPERESSAWGNLNSSWVLENREVTETVPTRTTDRCKLLAGTEGPDGQASRSKSKDLVAGVAVFAKESGMSVPAARVRRWREVWQES